MVDESWTCIAPKNHPPSFLRFSFIGSSIRDLETRFRGAETAPGFTRLAATPYV